MLKLTTKKSILARERLQLSSADVCRSCAAAPRGKGLAREVWAKLKHLQSSSCPFTNLPEKKQTQWALTREEMKNCVFGLRPELVGQIEFTEWTRDGNLRHSKFCGLKDDKSYVKSLGRRRDRTASA